MRDLGRPGALRTIVLGTMCQTLAACGGGSDHPPAGQPLAVAKAQCRAADNPETGLQGQVPAAVRASGFKGFNCNLDLLGQSRGDGASWQFDAFQDRNGHSCAYYDTSSSTVNRTHMGVAVLDVANPESPLPTTYLTSRAMMDPWESLKVNGNRQLLAAGFGLNTVGANGFDVYDISGDCRYPQLLSTVSDLASAPIADAPAAVQGHEGAFAPDGLTYYMGDWSNQTYHAIDITRTTAPVIVASMRPPMADPSLDPSKTGFASLKLNGGVHGLSVSDDGLRGYFIIQAYDPKAPGGMAAQDGTWNNGFMIVDLSEVQARKENATMKMIGSVTWGDGSGGQMTIPISIKGKPYVISVDEGGAGQLSESGIKSACAAGIPPFGMARIVDISDETAPKVVSRVMLESNDPSKCSEVFPDLAGQSGFTYDTHYCSVDNRTDATTLACANFQAGIRVYDIRDPLHVKEIAYFNPPAVTTPSPGSQRTRTAAQATGTRPDHCSAQIRLDAATGTLQTTCQDNGYMVLKFAEGVWPFPETSTPAGRQN